jgi:WD40 repeat protein/MinD-like ATPase involved in chromosome partitioning or flagellar assembly
MGSIVTFYSYKGGVGRSFALANVAAALANWGFRVLCVDWDLEAPGLSYYFKEWSGLPDRGLVQLISELRPALRSVESSVSKSGSSIIPSSDHGVDWRRYVIEVSLPNVRHKLGLIGAGSEDPLYTTKLQQINWPRLFEEYGFGSYLEYLRAEWRKEYDFVLIDSRTGITDISDICTIHLPDILVFLFTANHQSLDGVVRAVSGIQKTRALLPLNRTDTLLILPVASRFDPTTEYDEAQNWMQIFTTVLQPFYEDWAPTRTAAKSIPDLIRTLIERTTIPYFAKWSFGERIPVLIERDIGSTQLASFYLQTLAALIAHRFDNVRLLVEGAEKYIDSAKRVGHRQSASHYDVFVSSPQTQRIEAAQLIRTLQEEGLNVFDGSQATGSSQNSIPSEEALSVSQNLIFMVGTTRDLQAESQALQFMKQTLDDRSGRRVVPVIGKESTSELPTWLQSAERYYMGMDESFRTLTLRLIAGLSLDQRIRTITTLSGHTKVVLRMAWDPFGIRIATASADKTARIWNALDGRELARLVGHRSGVNRAVWSHSGSVLITCSFDHTMRVWANDTWECVREISAHSSDIPFVAWAPGDQMVATCSVGGSISLWDTTTWHQIYRFRADTGAVLRLVWLNDIQLCSGSEDGTLRIWNVRSFECEMVMKGHTGAVLDVAYHAPNEMLVSSSADRSIRVWDVHSGETKQTLQFNQAIVRSVTFSADGQWLASDAYDGWSCVLSTSTWSPEAFLRESPSEYWPCGIAFSPTGPLLASLAERDRVVRIRDCAGLEK